MIRIITDSTSSLPKDLREKLGIHLLNLVVNRGGVSHVEGEMDLDAQAMKYSESSSAAGCQARSRGLRARREKLPSAIPISSMRSSTA